MRSIWAIRPTAPDPTQIHPVLNSFADECRGMLVHLAAYVGVLALLVIIGAHLWGELQDSAGLEPATKPGWSLATRSHPAFAVSQFDLYGKTETYEIFRHPEGGRKDVLRWAAQGEKPVAELEIYRPGGEFERIRTRHRRNRRAHELRRLARTGSGWRPRANSARLRCFAWRSTPTMRRPVLASSNTLMSRMCGYPAGRAKATTCRPGAPRSAARTG